MPTKSTSLPILLIGAAERDGAIRKDSMRKFVDAFLDTRHEWILHDLLAGNYVHYDMDVFPEKGDALDHLQKASVVLGDHLYFDTFEPYPSSPAYFYNVRNSEIVDRAAQAKVPLFLFGDYPFRSRKPDEQGLGWRLYVPSTNLKMNPQDLAGRHIPERYLQGLPPALQRQRVVELTESRDAYQRGDYSELPTDRIARQMGLVKQSAYTTVAKARGIEWRGDSQDMAERVLEYYGAKPTQAQIRSFASALDQVFRKGLAAWKSGGHRPGATAQNWAVARVNSLVVGGKAAWTADKKQFAVLPEKVRLEVIDQIPDVIEALAAQGRIKDIEFLSRQMQARTNPSSINQDFGSERVKRGLAARVVKEVAVLDLARAVPSDRNRHSHPAASNPLVGWSYVGDPFPPEEIDRVSRPLFSPNAPKVYGEKLKSTILPIFVVIGRPPSESHPGTEAIELANQEAARGNTVLWIKQPLASYLRSLGQSEETIEIRLKLVRGEPSRLSPITPFTLLHRMGDVLRAEFKNEADEICRSFDWVTWVADDEQTLVKYFSSGVNTLAGRSGYLSNPKEAMSDLWAKYLLTGKIDYDPQAGGPWQEDVLTARLDYLSLMRFFFPRWLARCKGKIISVLGG